MLLVDSVAAAAVALADADADASSSSSQTTTQRKGAANVALVQHNSNIS